MDDAVGFFGPESVTWRVHADPSMLIGALRALLLQTLHPRTMAGFDQHSLARSDPWGRLQRTADYVATITFGTRAEAERAAARVRRLHTRLGTAVDPATGEEFRIDDPDLLRWVHCAEVDSLLAAYQQSGGDLTAAEADQYVREQRQAAALIGLPADSVPGSVAELEAYLTAIRPQLRVSWAARRWVLVGTFPPMPRWVRLATPATGTWAGLVALAFASLPAWARRMYGVPAGPGVEFGTRLAAHALRSALLALPAELREGPRLQAARLRVDVAAGAA